MTRARSGLFTDILYAQCWEDPDIDRKAFCTGPSDTIFSITSGGCNALAFLVDNPKKIFALDMNPSQNHLLDFKMAAFAGLPYECVLELLGVAESRRRGELYDAVRPFLRSAGRAYWDGQTARIAEGVIHTGRYERYMKLLRTWLRLLQGRDLLEALFAADGEEERKKLYAERWDSPSWRLFTRIFLSRRMMGALFTDEFFRFVEGSFSFGDHFAERVRGALTSPLLRGNSFASYILLGRYPDPESLPVYLRRENFDLIRGRLNRVEMVTGTCEDFFGGRGDSSIQKFNFSNIFEWMPPEAYASLLCEAYRVGAPGAVLTYRNLLVYRERPSALAGLFDSRRETARRLHALDRSFIYRNFVVERSRKGGVPWSTTSARSAIGAA